MPTNVLLSIVLLAACEYTSQPRTDLDPESCRPLGENIKAHGQKVPILGYWFGKRFVVADGGRRLAGMRLVGMTEVLAIDMGKEPTAAEIRMAQASIDQHREDLPPVDKSRLIKGLLDDGLSGKAVADALGVSQSYVCLKLKLLKLCVPVQKMVNDGTLQESTAYKIADATADPARQMELAVSGKKRHQIGRAPEAGKPVVRLDRFKYPMSGVEITVAGKDLSLVELLDALGQLTKEARRALDQGLDIKTLAAVAKDKASKRS